VDTATSVVIAADPPSSSVWTSRPSRPFAAEKEREKREEEERREKKR
jgi:hypothetical protein